MEAINSIYSTGRVSALITRLCAYLESDDAPQRRL